MLNKNIISTLIFSLIFALGLTASEGKYHTKEGNWGFIDLIKGGCFHHNFEGEESTEAHFVRKKKRTAREPLVLFQADTSACRIGLNDRALLQTGAVDFVTAFNGNDFACAAVVEENGRWRQKNRCCCCHKAHKNKEKTALFIAPANGQSFNTGVPPVGSDGPVPEGILDHVKFLAYSVNAVVPENRGVLTSTWVASGAQLKPENAVPLFGNAIKNPNEDFRIACYGLVSLVPELSLTNDWICTNEVIYALVERLPTVGSTYAAYTYCIPVFKRDPNIDPLHDFHKFQTVFDRANGTVTWVLDDSPVFQITQLGTRLTEQNAFVYSKKGKAEPLTNPTRFKVLDHGGIDELLEIINVQTGLAFFTLLDAYQPNNVDDVRDSTTIGLVRLESNAFRFPGIFFYNDPLVNAGLPANFVQNSVLNILTQQYESIIP
ncbi:MAG: hypothetical protein K2P98_04735, partial [Neisseriaceae bacterium]|nr:hypothetical protein [Neisseriaceae bacterium]